MASRDETILKKLLSQHLHRKGYSLDKISKELNRLGLVNNQTGEALSKKRIEELIEGINKQRSTGIKSQIK